MATEGEILRSKFLKELQHWDEMQFDIANLHVAGGLMKLSFRIDALTKVLIEKGVCTEEELDGAFQQIALDVLPEIRENLKDQLAEIKLRALRNGDFSG